MTRIYDEIDRTGQRHFSNCAGIKILSKAKLPTYQKSLTAQRVRWHLKLLRQLKYLTAQQKEKLQKVSELYRCEALNPLSCMTLDVEDIHSVMHHKYKLFTVLDYARKFGNAAKEGLKKPTHRAAYYFKSKFLVSFTRTCHYSVGHTSNLTVTSCTGWHLRAYRR